MTIAALSDTFGEHEYLTMPNNYDVVVHAGNISGFGASSELESFLRWFDDLDCYLKIFIAGNRDTCFTNSLDRNWMKEMMSDYRVNAENGSVVYLENTGINVWGVNFYGTPNTLSVDNMHCAFTEKYPKAINRVWAEIPVQTDVLVSHSPAMYKVDYSKSCKANLGDPLLRLRVKIVQPSIHICGHVKEATGVASDAETLYINACVPQGFDSDYVVQKVEIDEDDKSVVDVYKD